MEEIRILGTRIHKISLNETIVKIKEIISNGKDLWIITANPELIFKAEKDHRLQSLIEKADLVVPDGIGVVWAARQLGCFLQERVTGIDLTCRILEEGHKQGWRVFLLGARPGVAQKAITTQQRKYPGITFDSYHGYFTPEEEPQVIERIKNFKPDVLLVGLGAPRQESWNYGNPGIARVRMGVGGTFDVLAGEQTRAPRVFRQYNLEWFYRLIKEPARIRRQMILPLYVFKVLKLKYAKN